ncbi:glycoside hydrolase family 2 protein [Streptomyces sp. NPDC060194]|uniref:glycoside hydrolase family 2 protein n=1 Tax=Streptomyces sp. NPDC060194 TaxID=3347069 RepID=UPI00365CDE77
MTAAHLAAEGHPRPQLVRDPNWRDLSGPWGFAHDDADAGLAGGWMRDPAPYDRTITVPYPPESAASGIHDTGFHPVVWYRREFDAAVPAEGRRLLLHFGAVDHDATVWVNGRLAGVHQGGHTSFSFDVTGLLDPAGPQVVTVRAEDRPTDVTQPRGKQDWELAPHTVWYHRTTGIWQPVWLEEVPALRIESLHWTPDLPGGRVRCEVRLNTWPAEAHTVGVRLEIGDRLLAVHTALITGRELAFDVSVPDLGHGQGLDRLLWEPENPRLVDAYVTLDDAGGQRADEVASYLGLRAIGWDAGELLLNHKPYFLRFALQQAYWPQSLLAASGEELRREAELVKELGLNGVRIHQKIEDPRFLYWADRLGLLVWEEMPSAYAFGPTTVQRVVREWTEAVERDRSHPSIMAWVPVNESWGVHHIADRADQRHFADALYHLTKSLDPSRPAVSNDGWEVSAADIWGVHDYSQSGEVLRERYGAPGIRRGEFPVDFPAVKRLLLDGVEHRGQPVLMTEFGGMTYEPGDGENWHGYGTVGTDEEYAAKLTELIDAMVDSSLAGFCFTQLTDTEQETNGLLTEDRKPKLPVERLRAILTRTRQQARAERGER